VNVTERKRYFIVGLGSRADMFLRAILVDYAERATLVGFCDPNQTRMNYYNGKFAGRAGVPVSTFTPEQFADAVRAQRPDVVIVTSIDRTHDRYITAALELGCDVLTEKPMTIDAPRCQAILDCVRRTGRTLTVTFNYRYAPRNSRVKELLVGGVIGRVLSVHFEWLLDTRHGADYFRRWHRDKRNNGGLIVHKATHHFDLVNWWIDSTPQTVFGFGDLRFYGQANATARGEPRSYSRAHGSAEARKDPFALHLEDNAELRELYLNAEHEDGYFRDQCVFGEGITTEDDMAVVVRYASGATMSYHLTAYAPWEGYRVMFNGTKGRLEFEMEESGYAEADVPGAPLPPVGAVVRDTKESARLLVRPHWQKPYEVPISAGAVEGHGGGDARMLAELFGPPAGPDPLRHAATYIDGAHSILTGIAASLSFGSGQPVHIRDLVTF
jgi:predicted dehydrogenase